ncbi:MAG: DUF5817 domain-containing protein [Halonotius sp.]
MYAVVGCSDCGTLWLLADPSTSESAQCQRCGRTHQTAKLKHLFESEDRAAAREARSALLAKKRGESAAFADVDHVSELEQQADTAAVDDEEYLEAAGIDAEAVAAAAESTGDQPSSDDDIVRAAVREAGEDDQPAEAAIVAYATDRGVPAEKARKLLERLCREGEASKDDGRYRLL